MGTIPDATLDITRETCPMTFVRTRIALDRLGSGRLLEVLLSGDEPRRSVPQAATGLGHAVVSTEERGEGVLALLIRTRD